MRPLLVGESNPHGGDPRHALYPRPEGCADWRLCHVVLDMDEGEYLRNFERVNLIERGSWSAPTARAAAVRLRTTRPEEQPFVLLGARVAAAFGLAFAPFLPGLFSGGRRYVVLPHPSGRCRLWNEPGAYARARTAVAELVGFGL